MRLTSGVLTMKPVVWLCVLSGLAGAGLALGLSSGAWESRSVAQEAPPAPPLSVAPAPAAPTPANRFTAEELVNIAVYDNVNRSVVNITTKGVRADRFLLLEVPSEGEGSGVVLDRQGHILTNYHVIDGARQIEVTLFDGKNYPAQLVGGDRGTDVAVLKIVAAVEVLHPVRFRQLDRLARRAAGLCHWKPLRPGADVDHRHHLQLESFSAQPPERSFDQVDHSDRRGDQPGQLRRAAVGQP